MSRDVLPRLDSGVTHLDGPGPRSTALHRLVVAELGERDGAVYWLDVRNVAGTYALDELAPRRRLLDDVRIARAFTAYQHHTLAKRLVRAVDARTAMVVAPNLASLYEDDDVPDYEADDLFRATATLLAEVGATYDVPVLVTTDASGTPLPPAVADDATTVACERTRLGLHYASADFETQLYVEDGFWQTTIPYWVELLGAARRVDPAAVAPTEPAAPPETLSAWN